MPLAAVTWRYAIGQLVFFVLVTSGRYMGHICWGIIYYRSFCKTGGAIATPLFCVLFQNGPNVLPKLGYWGNSAGNPEITVNPPWEDPWVKRYELKRPNVFSKIHHGAQCTVTMSFEVSVEWTSLACRLYKRYG